MGLGVGAADGTNKWSGSEAWNGQRRPPSQNTSGAGALHTCPAASPHAQRDVLEALRGALCPASRGPTRLYTGQCSGVRPGPWLNTATRAPLKKGGGRGGGTEAQILTPNPPPKPCVGGGEGGVHVSRNAKKGSPGLKAGRIFPDFPLAATSLTLRWGMPHHTPPSCPAFFLIFSLFVGGGRGSIFCWRRGARAAVVLS